MVSAINHLLVEWEGGCLGRNSVVTCRQAFGHSRRFVYELRQGFARGRRSVCICRQGFGSGRRFAFEFKETFGCVGNLPDNFGLVSDG